MDHFAGVYLDGLGARVLRRSILGLMLEVVHRSPRRQRAVEELARFGIEPLRGLEGTPVLDGQDDILRRLVSRRRSERAADVAGRPGPQLDDRLASGPHCRLSRRVAPHDPGARNPPGAGSSRPGPAQGAVNPSMNPRSWYDPLGRPRNTTMPCSSVVAAWSGSLEELEGLDRPAGGAAVDVEQPDP